MTRQHAIQSHYEVFWNNKSEKCLFDSGPVEQLPDDFQVIKLPPSLKRGLWTYATCCMSQPGDRNQLELHIFSPQENEFLPEILYAIAHFHRTSALLNLGHTVNFGKPWFSESLCDYGLISLPYLDGPNLENCDYLGDTISCLWLVPITAAERNYKKEFGLEALESIFDEKQINYADPFRGSLV
jgi:hypothetical protein